jgi:hypothetical protein
MTLTLLSLDSSISSGLFSSEEAMKKSKLTLFIPDSSISYKMAVPSFNGRAKLGNPEIKRSVTEVSFSLTVLIFQLRNYFIVNFDTFAM